MSLYKILVFLLLAGIVASQDDAAASTSASSSSKSSSPLPPPSSGGNYDLPPPPHGGGGPPFGGPLGGLGFPGLGFHKNFDFNYGLGYGVPGLGGLGGLLGGLPPPPGGIDGDIPPPDLGGFGGFPGGFGGFTPSYVPQTWIGSALGAKGDLLFPIVIFVFFVVGIWTVVQLLLGFIVPLIASKLAVKSALLNGAFIKRDAPTISPGTVQQPDLDFITTAVMEAINEPKCLKFVACHTGNFLNGMAGGGTDAKKEDGGPKDYEGILKTLSNMARSETLDLFEQAFLNGKADCSTFTCYGNTTDPSPTNPSAPTKTNGTTSGVTGQHLDDPNSVHANEVH